MTKKAPTMKTYNGNVTSWQHWLELKEQGYTGISGNFDCSNNNLTSLEGAPQTVGRDFYCSRNNITSLKGAPHTVGDGFYCYYNKLTNLEDAPHTVGGFYCSNNKLTNLKGAPHIVSGDFYCSHNKLTSLEGAPHIVGGWFNCSNNKLTSLEGAPHTVGGSFNCSNNKLTSLEGAPKENVNQFDNFLAKGYIFVDGILTKLVSSKTSKDGTVIYKTTKLGTDTILYIVRNQYGVAAHGATMKKAIRDLRFKVIRSNLDVTELVKQIKERGTVTFNDYRLLTGACQAGLEHGLASLGKEGVEEMTLTEALRLSEGQYGGKQFRELFA